MRRHTLVWCTVLAACQPRPSGTDEPPCDDAQPGEGEVRVQPWCDDVEMTEGEGAKGDWWLSNSHFKAIIRHPLTALTVPGVGGGTLIDGSPWGYKDRLHEVIPIVGGGWLDVDTFEVHDDGITVGGLVVPLPDREPTTPGERRTVRWIVEPDTPWLKVEGTDGLWIHVAGDTAYVDGRVADDLVLYGHDGTVAEDLGGVIRAEDATALSMAPTDEGWALDIDGQPLSGVAEGAERIVLLSGDATVGWVPVDDGVFATTVQAHVDAVRAEAEGFGPSAATAPGEDLELSIGDTATLDLTVGWNGALPRPVRVDWSDATGRQGYGILRSSGEPLALGEGVYSLTFGAGPTVAPIQRDDIELRPGQSVPFAIEFVGFDPGDRTLAAVGWHADRSRTWRGSDEEALREALGAGVGFAVAAAEDDLVDVDPYNADETWIRSRDGASFTGPAWTLTSWPWSDSSNKGGHGALTPSLIPDPVDALAAMWGGESANRFVAVDYAWLAEVGAPWTTRPQPDFVHLPEPGPGGPITGVWRDWFAWLDAGADLVPLGPYTWVDVPDPAYLAEADVEQGLVRGEVCATTGPLVTLDIDGLGPGDVRPEASGDTGDTGAPPPRIEPSHIRAAVQDATGSVLYLALFTNGGELLASWAVHGGGERSLDVVLDGTWVIAVAWSGDGNTWAVTGPVWSSAPS